MGLERKLLCCTKQRLLTFLRYTIRKGALEDLAISSRIPGKRARDAQRFTFINTFINTFTPKSWTITRCCPKQSKLEKHHGTSRARTAMTPTRSTVTKNADPSKSNMQSFCNWPGKEIFWTFPFQTSLHVHLPSGYFPGASTDGHLPQMYIKLRQCNNIQ